MVIDAEVGVQEAGKISPGIEGLEMVPGAVEIAEKGLLFQPLSQSLVE